MAENHLVDIRLRELLRLDLVFLARAEEVVKEGDVELEDFDEFDDAAVGDVEFAVEVERARVAFGTVFGDLPIVDVAGEFRGVLVFLVLGLERADADAVLLGEDEAAHADVAEDARPVALVAFHAFVEHLAAERAEVALDGNLVEDVLDRAGVERFEDGGALVDGNQMQRFLVHRAIGVSIRAVEPFLTPAEGVERAFVGFGVRFQAFLQEPRDGAFGAADGAVQEQDAALGAVALRGAHQDVDEVLEGFLQAEDRVLAVVDGILEELVARQFFLVDGDLVHAVAEDHVVDALVRGARDFGVGPHDVQIFAERAVPVFLLVIGAVLAVGDEGDQIRSGGHWWYPSAWVPSVVR